MIGKPDEAAALACTDLSVGYRGSNGVQSIVRNVTLTVASGAALGIVGESGSGKSTLALALANCLPPGGVVTGGSIGIGGDTLGGQGVQPSRRDLAKRMSVVFQNPPGALDPGQKIASVFQQRLRMLGVAPPDRAARARALLESVRLRHVDQVLGSYPHQLSGGMQQRVIIALALANDPAVLVLDEPTTGLDATVASEILELLKTLRRERHAGLVFISHDIGQVHDLCDEIAVMYGGELVEQGPADELIAHPRHPYTRALLACLPSVRQRRALLGIEGAPPSPSQLGALTGCLFAPRCTNAAADCSAHHPDMTMDGARRYRCSHPSRDAASPVRAVSVVPPDPTPASERGLKVQGLNIAFWPGNPSP